MTVDPNEWRLRNIERRLEQIERTDPAVLVERIAQLERRLEGRIDRLDRTLTAQDEEVGTLRKSIVAAAISIAVSAVITAATVYLVFGS